MKKQKLGKKLLGPFARTISNENTGSWRTRRPMVDQESCVRCGTCVEYCPPGVITIQKTGDPAVKIDFYNCKGCGICASLCPREAITMIAESADNEK